MKDRLFGSKSLVTCMVKKRGDGALGQQVGGMVSGFGKKLGRSGYFLMVGYPTKWVVGRE